MEKTEELKTSGWLVLVVWECELKNDAQAVIHKIIEELKRVKNGL